MEGLTDQPIQWRHNSRGSGGIANAVRLLAMWLSTMQPVLAGRGCLS